MRYFHCTGCKNDEPIEDKDFWRDCRLCGSPMQVREVRDEIIDREVNKKMNEVKTRNPNTGTLVEVVQREDGNNLVEKTDHQESGVYETAEQKRAQHKNIGTRTSTPFERL